MYLIRQQIHVFQLLLPEIVFVGISKYFHIVFVIGHLVT